MRLFSVLAFGLATASAQQQAHTLTVAPGKSITLSLPARLDIAVAATKLPRVRFFAPSPDGRVFATTMYSLADNRRGAVYVLEGFDAQTHGFTKVTPYLEHLRNPNSLAFYTDEKKQAWLYLALTDRLVRYKYSAGDSAPTGPPQLLTRFPDYGLGYKYGGWHLTRTVAIATLHGRPRVYVATGSSCNYCKELEAVRASVVSMDPDGGRMAIVAHGLRNAVDLRFVPGLDGGAVFATNMGDDHLGDQAPEDTMFEIDAANRQRPTAGAAALNYGWPKCYFDGGKAVLDDTPLPMNPGEDAKTVAPKPAGPPQGDEDSVYGEQKGVAAAGTNLAAQTHTGARLPNVGAVPEPLTRCDSVPAAYTTFSPHASPLGLAYFGGESTVLANSFLVALHGASHPHIGTGYRVVRFTAGNRKPQDFITGFVRTAGGKTVVRGRPCGMLQLGPDTFLLSDDFLGAVYIVYPKK